ncbi:MAG: hypothetical protein HQK83_01410 [Fibrobacteria bacterium]|nr:hypothetical protein [Fibrobacteria bacterium]
MAGLLKAYLEQPDTHKQALDDYSRYLSWLSPEQKTADSTPLDDQYHYWNKLSGHSKGLLQYVSKDRTKPLSKPINWSVALDSLRSGHNTGAIIRSAEAFGFNNVIIPDSISPSLQNKSLQSAAMGTENWITTTYTSSLYELLLQEREKHQTFILGLELTENAEPFLLNNPVEIPDKGILVVGNEERGISSEILSLCQKTVSIPLYGRKFSLNVASAFAVAAFFIRQRIDKMVE